MTDETKTRQEKIQNLINTTFKKGLIAAVAAARAYKDPYILDEFHDLLTKMTRLRRW